MEQGVQTCTNLTLCSCAVAGFVGVIVHFSGLSTRSAPSPVFVLLGVVVFVTRLQFRNTRDSSGLEIRCVRSTKKSLQLRIAVH